MESPVNKVAFEKKNCSNVKLTIKIFHPASNIQIRITAMPSFKNEKVEARSQLAVYFSNSATKYKT